MEGTVLSREAIEGKVVELSYKALKCLSLEEGSWGYLSVLFYFIYSIQLEQLSSRYFKIISLTASTVIVIR